MLQFYELECEVFFIFVFISSLVSFVNYELECEVFFIFVFISSLVSFVNYKGCVYK